MVSSEKAKRRPVNGIVLIDKPSGSSSNRVLQSVKRAFMAAKAGHTGSLDPLATGMLPICLGAATKVSGLLLDSAKSYRVTARLGIATDTGDADGAVIEEMAAPAASREQVAAVLARFHGEIQQVPPMYSAIKHEGRRLYELARRGEHVERKPRTVSVSRIEIERVDWPEIEFVVDCSKGTYMRSLVIDVAAALGTVGHVTALRRLWVDPYRDSKMVGLDKLIELAGAGLEAVDRLLLPADTAVRHWPRVSLDETDAARLCHGQRLVAEASWPEGLVRLYGLGGRFLGVGEVLAIRELRSRRLFLD